MSRHTFLTAALLCLAGLTLDGCVLSPNLDEQFGSSVHQAAAQQTLDPQAWRNTTPVRGLDGKTATAVYDNYVKSYREPDLSGNALKIGVGTH
ncbi:pilus assembly protein [Rugamonas sp.]|uniref:pilus assembly protein n=1 Tax=Rugamonas sp. TaxID=1926287 RepID=UPI0025F90AF4|nr:pilus assembly protein [Rugamonas sp.]